MSIPWKTLQNTTGFINEQFLKPTADITAEQGRYLMDVFMKLPAALNPAIGPSGIAKPHDPTKWVAQNVLGQGGFGIASLWRYNDPGHKYDNLQVVLKIGTGTSGERHMLREGKVMNTLSSRNEEHLVNMIYVDKDFTKLYLEYCTEGDLTGLMRKLKRNKSPASEEEVWRILLCLTKGAHTMHQYAPTSVIHYDLKPDNVLIQPYPPYHSCGAEYTTYKIGDFGLASEKTKGYPPMGSLQHADNEGVKGTPTYYSPEMFELNFLKHPEDRPSAMVLEGLEWEMIYGLTTKLDIWAIGAIVWELMVNERKPVTGPYQLRLEGQDNSYYCPANRFVKYAGQCFGPKILKSGYSKDLINIVQWCLMKLPGARCSAEELLPHVEAQVDAITAQRIERAAREARVKEAQERVAGNAPNIIEASMAAVEQRVQEELRRKRAERSAKRQKMNYEPRTAELAVPEPSASTNTQQQEPGGVYAQMLKKLLEADGRPLQYFNQLRNNLSLRERNRLIDAFLFLEGDSEAWTDYVNNGGNDRGNPGEDQDMIVTIQMVHEATPQEMVRCMQAYMQRIDLTNSSATRMEIVVRQRRYEGTPAYRLNLLNAFRQRFAQQPDFMQEYSDLAKMRFQRAYESTLPHPERPEAPVLTKTDRTALMKAFKERMDHEKMYSAFEEIMNNEGRTKGDWVTEAVNLQLAYEPWY